MDDTFQLFFVKERVDKPKKKGKAMKKRLMGIISLLLLALPALALADAAIVQTFCEEIPGSDLVRIGFALVNFSLPTSVCDAHFIPEPQPPSPGCTMLECSNPDGWSCFLNPFGGADWFANTPGDCIPPGGSLFGFDIILNMPVNVADVCCYIVQFTDATGAVILEQEECFTCKVVENEPSSWGTIKARYR
jgi:hypothetical protein